jgi:hypothetical protein
MTVNRISSQLRFCYLHLPTALPWDPLDVLPIASHCTDMLFYVM